MQKLISLLNSKIIYFLLLILIFTGSISIGALIQKAFTRTEPKINGLPLSPEVILNHTFNRLTADAEGIVIEKETGVSGPNNPSQYVGRITLERDKNRVTIYMLLDTLLHTSSEKNMITFEDLKVGDYIIGGIHVLGSPFLDSEPIYIVGSRFTVDREATESGTLEELNK